MSKITEEAPLNAFMQRNVPIDECGAELSRLVAAYGEDLCLRTACKHLRAGIASQLINAYADAHQEVTFAVKDGVMKGSLVDLAIESARQRGEEFPTGLVELLLARGVKAHPDCDNEIVLRFRTIDALAPKFDQTAEGKTVVEMLKDFGAKAAAVAFRTVGMASPFAKSNDLKL